MESAAENDPGFAIGTAKELVETVCKTFLKERSIARVGTIFCVLVHTFFATFFAPVAAFE